jgi:hypothetical protein
MNNLVFNTASSELRTLITNTTVTVEGSVTISNASLDVVITNDTVTVEGSVTISNASIAVTGGVSITGHTVETLSDSADNTTGTGVLFADTDISDITTGSFFFYNTGTSSVTVSLELSPTTTETFYIPDPDNDDYVVAQDGNLIIAIGKFANYARLLFDAGAGATFEAYYIGQM